MDIKISESIIIGSIVQFANHDWKILKIDTDNQTALVISANIIFRDCFHSEVTGITWAQCSLRSVVNGGKVKQRDGSILEFLTEADINVFTEKQIYTPDNVLYETLGGEIVMDKIWIPSVDDVEKFLPADADRQLDEMWWLRDPGYYQFRAACVRRDGSISFSGDTVCVMNGVRLMGELNLKYLK